MMLEKLIRTVKGQLTYFDSQIRKWSRAQDRPGYDPYKLDKYRRLADEFQDVLDYLIQQRRAQYGVQFDEERQPEVTLVSEPEASELDNEIELEPPAPATQEITEAATPSSKPHDLSDLPPELLKELSGSFKGETDPLIEIIEDHGGTASIDEILVDLYRKYGEVGKRTIVSNKLYRFSRRGLCAALPGRKGFYTTDAAMLHADSDGQEDDEGPDAGTSGPSSNGLGASGSTEGPSKPSPVGSIPSASTLIRRKLFASTAVLPDRVSR